MLRNRWFVRLSAGGRWIRTSGSWSDLLRRDALPGDLPVFLAFRCGLISPITPAATGLQVATEIPATMGSREGTTSVLTTRRHPATLIRSPSHELDAVRHCAP